MADFGVFSDLSTLDRATKSIKRILLGWGAEPDSFDVRSNRARGMRFVYAKRGDERFKVVMFPEDEQSVVNEEEDDELEDDDEEMSASLTNSGVKGKRHVASFFEREDADQLIFVSSKLSAQANNLLRAKSVDGSIDFRLFTYEQLCIPSVLQFEYQPMAIEVISGEALLKLPIKVKDMQPYFDDDPLMKEKGISAGAVIRFTSSHAQSGVSIDYGRVLPAYHRSFLT